MNLRAYLKNRGVDQPTIQDLLLYIPEKMNAEPIDDFCDAKRIMDPDSWFYWPGQKRFVVVGHCPNGDGVAIDTQIQQGAVFYVAHELLHDGQPLDDIVVKVATSPSHYVQLRGEDDFPWDYWDARERNPDRVSE